jgi:hypothetical protein
MLVGHVVNDATEPFVSLQVRYVSKPPSGEVVDDGDGFALVDKEICQMGTDESGAASD